MIKLEKVSRTYRNGKAEVYALKDISLEINAGEFVAIMGHSGSGKSTLLNILGFLDKPDSGTYTVLDREINNLTDDELSTLRNQVCGFVFQQFHLLPRITVHQNVSLPLIYSGKEQDHEAIAARIKDVGLDHRSGHLSNELSGGGSSGWPSPVPWSMSPLFFLLMSRRGISTQRQKRIFF